MRTLLKALPDFFLCILRSLPYLNKPVFIKGDLWQWKVPARVPSRLYWDLPSSRRYCPACRFIYLFSLIYLFTSFIFSFFIFYFQFLYLLFFLIFSFLYLYFFISCETHVQCTRGKVNEERDPKMKMWHLATMKSLQGVT